jgi:hypothetical protein
LKFDLIEGPEASFAFLEFFENIEDFSPSNVNILLFLFFAVCGWFCKNRLEYLTADSLGFFSNIDIFIES